METPENYLADKPVSRLEDDKFQRYSFSRRVAETIANRVSPDSLVVGLYGAWGEGKTSVLNFIKAEITTQNSDIVQFTFNPWRFTDEAALLTSYFNTLGTALKNSLSDNAVESTLDIGESKPKSNKTGWFKRRKGALKTNRETIGEIISEYGKLVSVFSAGETAEAIGRAMSNVNVDVLKERIENLLKLHKRRIVIYIDDIDRLDRSEIHSIFRLVKLTGDFSYTTYVLSFDNEIVAESIGERFGNGDKNSGADFLEKIIQVPLVLPKVQKAALRNYCFELVQNALDSSKINISDQDAKRFASEFNEGVLQRLNTPRLAVRYGNALSFALPLLKGEVNLVDFMLVEAIRVFYPNHYKLIHYKQELFLQSYNGSSFSYSQNSSSDSKKKRLTSELEKAGEKLTENERRHVQNLLVSLFPFLNGAFSNIHYSEDTYVTWHQEKRICSHYYFNRYFSYAVLMGDISDVAFDDLINSATPRRSIFSTHQLVFPHLENRVQQFNS